MAKPSVWAEKKQLDSQSHRTVKVTDRQIMDARPEGLVVP